MGFGSACFFVVNLDLHHNDSRLATDEKDNKKEVIYDKHK